MRVANQTVYDTVKHHLASITENLNRASEIVTTGKRINTISDDPVGLTQSLSLQSSLSHIDQMGRNINTGKSWLATSEGALTQVQDIISDIKALTVQMSSATTGAGQRMTAAATIQNQLEEIISLANTSVNGQYVFAGSRTDSAAFDAAGVYQGDSGAFSIKIGKDTIVEMGKDGSAVFGGIVSTLQGLKTALESDDIDGVRTSITSLDGHFDGISAEISDVGSKMLRMEIKEKIFADNKFANTERLSTIVDADITEAILNLSAKEMAYQAALASSAKVMQLSLVDYMQ